ncbi:Panacea domain-containing protein [Companilactobacillus muriivasis]|uniref:Panacea domain-containing protein n=1 Tax=Companilactobacillus muriivasis TaxID=3081444 RepID=UPI0030C74436
MYKHFIVIADSYKKGSRIAYKETSLSTDRGLLIKITNISDTLKNNNITSYSTHLIDTEGSSWQSIIDSDPFFKDILILNNIEDFIADYQDEVTSADIAEYIAERFSLTALPLMKLVYFVYSDFLADYKRPLFENNFVAFKYGPVDTGLWEKYKFNYRSKIEPVFKSDNNSISPVISKLIKVGEYEHVKSILDSITKDKRTIEDSYFLKNLTHESDTPWIMSYDEHQNNKITDDMIYKYHAHERVY